MTAERLGMAWLQVLRRLSAGAVPGGPQGPDRPTRVLWIDLSIITIGDRGTGVQRVVRNLAQQLCLAPPSGWRVVPIASTGLSPYREIDANFDARQPASGVRAKPAAGDVFLGLDLAPRIVWYRCLQLMRWRWSGVAISFVVYDLLPDQHPDWFSAAGVRWFRRWLQGLAVVCDRLICISQSARRDIDAWMLEALGSTSRRPIARVIALGSDLGAAGIRVAGSPDDPSIGAGSGFVLMVGTIEPRKAVAAVLDAFENLWSTGEPCMLVIAGRAGWKVDDLILRLRVHPEAGHRLRWIDGPTDDQLQTLYRRCRGLVMASRGEGFGLPVIEAMRAGKPVLARDIPILREVAAQADAVFFADDAPQALAATLRHWLDHAANGAMARTGALHHTSWADSARELVRALDLRT